MDYFSSAFVELNGNYYEIFFDEYGVALSIEYIYKAYFG